MKIKINVLGLLISAALLTSCSMSPDDGQLTYTGTIEADQIKISTEIGGVLSDVSIEEGQAVKVDSEIATIDMKDLKLELKKAGNRLELAKTKLEDVLNGARNEEIKSARANVNKAKAQLEGLRKNYEYRLDNYTNLEKLHKEGVVSNQQLEDSKALLDSAYANLKGIEKQYEASTAALELLLNGATENNIKISQLDVQRVDLEIENMKNQLDKCKIKAPIDGIIGTLNFKKGELLSPGGVIATVIDMNNLWVKIYVPEKQLHKVNLGQELNILTDSKTKSPIKGRVIYISPEAEFTPKNVESKENKEEMVFEVKLKVLSEDTSLKPGMLVDMKLEEVN